MAKTNNFGDIQLESDVACDKVIFAELSGSKYIAHAHSEENIEVK
jgi:fructose-1,6-bisphosphatase